MLPMTCNTLIAIGYKYFCIIHVCFVVDCNKCDISSNYVAGLELEYCRVKASLVILKRAQGNYVHCTKDQEYNRQNSRGK